MKDKPKEAPTYDYSSYVDQRLVKWATKQVKLIQEGKAVIKEDGYR